MNFILAITTFNRAQYLQRCLDTWQNTRANRHTWKVVIADDGSDDNSLQIIEEFSKSNEVHLIKNARLGVHQQMNSIIDFLQTQEFDFCFKVDDDLEFINEGWDTLYYNTATETGFQHLVYHDLNWAKEHTYKEPIRKHNLIGYTDLLNAQGIFYTFNKEALKKVGFFDVENFGFRGMGHVDFTARMCRAGYNNINHPFDVNESNQFLRAANKNYKSALPQKWTSAYDVKERSKKEKVILDSSRIQIEKPEINNQLYNQFLSQSLHYSEDLHLQKLNDLKNSNAWYKSELTKVDAYYKSELAKQKEWIENKYRKLPDWILRLNNKLNGSSTPLTEETKPQVKESKLNFKNIFIVTYGRSGSTLLQGILNSLDNVTIFGENHDMLKPMFQSYNRLALTQRNAEPKQTVNASHSWHGAEQLSPQEYLEWAKALTNRLYPAHPNETIGFKEIRYHQSGNELDGYLNFMKLLWPDALFIFLTREKSKVAQSAWWADKPQEQVFKMIEDFEARTLKFAKLNPEYCLHIDYNDVVSNNSNLKSLIEKIGAEYDSESITEILDKPHSSGNSKKAPKLKINADPNPELKAESLLAYHKSETPLRFNEEFQKMRNALTEASDKITYLEQKLADYDLTFGHQPKWYKSLGKTFGSTEKLKQKS